jgi:hypothetical protein
MCFEDTVKYFIGVNVVLAYDPEPVGHAPKIWNTFRHNFWFQLSDEGKYGMKGELYEIDVFQEGHFFFSVHQKDRRVVDSPGYFDFGVTVLKPLENDDFELVVSSGNSMERQLQCQIHVLKPGYYWVIPTSSGTKMAQYKDNALKKGEQPVLKRSGGLVVHSLSAFETRVMNSQITDKLRNRIRECAVELPVTESVDAEKKDIYNDGGLIVSNIKSGYAGRSYAVQNNTHLSKFKKPDFFSVTFDFSASKNVISSTGSLIAEVTVAPGEIEIGAHVFPSEDSGGFTVTVKRSQKRLTAAEAHAYLAGNPEIAERLHAKGIQV